VGNVIKRVVFGVFGPLRLALGPVPKTNFLTRVFLETRLESEFLESLIDHLVLLGQMLWPKKLNFDKNKKV